MRAAILIESKKLSEQKNTKFVFAGAGWNVVKMGTFV